MLADVHVHVHVCSILLFLLTAVKNGGKGRWCIKSRRRCTDFNFFFSFFIFHFWFDIVGSAYLDNCWRCPFFFSLLRHVSVTISPKYPGYRLRLSYVSVSVDV